MSKKPKGNNTAVVVLLTVLIFVMIALTGLVIWMCVNLVNKTPQAYRPDGDTDLYPSHRPPDRADAGRDPAPGDHPAGTGACGGYRFHRHHGRSADAQAGV